MLNATLAAEFPTATVQNSPKSEIQDANLKKACSDFESIFLQYILKSARNTLPGNELFDRTHESKMYKSMMDEKLAVTVARGKGTGLADMLYGELSVTLDSSVKYGNFSEELREPIKTLKG